MTGHPLIANPLGWAHLQIYGGMRKLLTFAGGYTVIISLLLVLVYRLIRSEVTFARYCSTAMFIVLALQGVFLFFLGTASIKRAIFQDFTSDMISSHRLTGMSGYTAVIGYLTGPTCQVFIVTAVNYVFCTILAVLGRYSIREALLLNAAMLLIAVLLTAMFWTLSVLVGLSTRGKIAMTGILAGFLFTYQLPFFDLFPGLQMIISRTAITKILYQGDLSEVGGLLLFTMGGQFVLAGLFFLASVRKFGRDDVLAFSPMLAYALVAVCSLIGAIGIAYYEPRPSPLLREFQDPRKQLIATIIALLVISFLPVINAAKSALTWSRRKRKDAAFNDPRPRSFIETAAISSLILISVIALICSGEARKGRFESSWQSPADAPVFVPIQPGRSVTPLPAAAANPATPPDTSSLVRRSACTTAVVILTLITVGGLLRFFYSYVEKAVWVFILYIVFLWAIPLFSDLTLEAISGNESFGHRTLLFTASPVGLLIAAWMEFDAPLKAGMIVQVAIAGFACVLSRRAKN